MRVPLRSRLSNDSRSVGDPHGIAAKVGGKHVDVFANGILRGTHVQAAAAKEDHE